MTNGVPRDMIHPDNLSEPRLVFSPTVTLLAMTTPLPSFDEAVGRVANGSTLEQLHLRQDLGTGMERVVEFAGRNCYDSYGRGRSSGDFHAHIAAVRHGSVLEHVSFTFHVTGVSRGLTHELVRHRVGTAISQRSTRYVDETDSRVVVPPRLVIQDGDDADAVAAKRSAQAALLAVHDNACEVYQRLYDAARSCGGTVKEARGVARSALPTNVETSLVWTCNLRALLNAAAQRARPEADLEIRRLFLLLVEVASVHAPHYFSPPVVDELVDADGKYLDIREL